MQYKGRYLNIMASTHESQPMEPDIAQEHVAQCQLTVPVHLDSCGRVFQRYQGNIFPYCFMLLFLHGFPHGLAPRSPDTDLLTCSYGTRLPPAQWITPPAPFLNLVLWLLVCVKETQNSEHSKVDSGHLDTQSRLSGETHAQKLSSHSVCNACVQLSVL